MPIKDKSLKKSHSDTRIKIDVIHNDKVKNYKKKKQDYIDFKKQLNNINEEDIFDHKTLYYKKKIDEYENTMNDNEDNYYLDNGLILNKYYNNIYNSNNKEINKNDIVNWFNIDKSNDQDNSDCNNNKNGKLNNNENEDDDIITKYLSKIDDE